MPKCAHCQEPGQFPLNRCVDCAKVGHNQDVELCLCQHLDGPGIVGVAGVFSHEALAGMK